MILPVQVTFRNVPSSARVEADIQEHAGKLETYFKPITSCRVMVEAPARHHEKGFPYHVRIDLTVPGKEIVVRRSPTLHAAERQSRTDRPRKMTETRPERRNLDIAIREAFDAARRRLEDHARRIRADVKKHELLPEARVTKLFSASGYGYLETPEGEEIYFHAHSVLGNGFKKLRPGSRVTFVEEAGEKGPQASTVKLIGKEQAPSLLPMRRKVSGA